MTWVSRLSILHVCCTDAFAGVERHMAALAADQAARGHEVHVIGGHPEIITRHLGNRQVAHQPARTIPQTFAAMRRVPRPSVINAHMTAAELAAVTSVRMRGVPVVSTRHFAQPRGSRPLSPRLVRAAGDASPPRSRSASTSPTTSTTRAPSSTPALRPGPTASPPTRASRSC